MVKTFKTPAPRTGWRPAELAEQHGFSRRAIYAWIAADKLRTVRIGRTILVLDEDWKSFLAQHRTA